jgi:hypothetical protein
MKKLLLVLLLSVSLKTMAQTPDANSIMYVNKNVVGGTGSGNSWENAIPELADALKWANANKSSFTTAVPLQIWVAKGTYYPLYTLFRFKPKCTKNN